MTQAFDLEKRRAKEGESSRSEAIFHTSGKKLLGREVVLRVGSPLGGGVDRGRLAAISEFDIKPRQKLVFHEQGEVVVNLPFHSNNRLESQAGVIPG